MKRKCLVCGGRDINEMVSYESYPLCIGVVPERLKGQLKSFPLKVGICGSCTHIQQVDGIEDRYKELMYSGDSAELLSSVPTPSQVDIGRDEAKKCFDFFMSCGLPLSGKVVDIGCYDGYFLSLVKSTGYDTLGVEPNPASRIAEEKYGIPIIREYFPGKSFLPASVDVIVLRNILEHMVDLHAFLDAVEKVLKPGGHAVIEVPNMLFHLERATQGCFFHQHLSYFTLYTMLELLSKHHLEYVSSSAGYALYLCVKKTDMVPFVPANIEKVTEDLIKKFRQKYEKTGSDLKKLIDDHKNVAVFGAGGHTAGLFYMLGKKYVDRIKFVYDSNPMKHGNFLADFPVPVRAPGQIRQDGPDLIIISTGLHQDGILGQLKEMGLKGAGIAVIYPEVKVV